MMTDEIPENVDDWKPGTITNIISSGYYESDILEFKEDISKDGDRIARTTCAFSNTKGGFIVFGISDDRTKSIPERMIGLPKSQDNVSMITNQILNIIPQIDSNKIIFKKSSIDLGNNREIVVVKVNRSNELHQYNDIFYKRHQGKNHPMIYSEISSKFIENKRNEISLFLLMRELSFIKTVFEQIIEQDKTTGILAVLNYTESFQTDFLFNFLLSHVYLYDIDTANLGAEVLEVISKLKNLRKGYDMFQRDPTTEIVTGILKNSSCQTVDEYFVKHAQYFSKIGLEHLKNLEKKLGAKIPDIVKTKYDVSKGVSEIK